jgi:hypothetical protein
MINLKKSPGWWARKLWNENTVEIQGWVLVYIEPIVDLQLG